MLSRDNIHSKHQSSHLNKPAMIQTQVNGAASGQVGPQGVKTAKIAVKVEAVDDDDPKFPNVAGSNDKYCVVQSGAMCGL